MMGTKGFVITTITTVVILFFYVNYILRRVFETIIHSTEIGVIVGYTALFVILCIVAFYLVILCIVKIAIGTAS